MIDLTEWEWEEPAPDQKHVRVLMHVRHNEGYVEGFGFKRNGVWTITDGTHVVGPVVAWAPERMEGKR